MYKFARSQGVHLLIPMKTYRTCDFTCGGGPDPLSPSGPAHGSSLKLYFPSQTYVFSTLDGNL